MSSLFSKRQAILYCLSYYLLLFLFIVLFTVIIGKLSPEGTLDNETVKVLMVDGALITSTIIMVWRVQKRLEKTRSSISLAEYLGLQIPPSFINLKFVVKWTVLLLLMYGIVVWVSIGTPSSNISALQIFSSVIFAPINEEILFRGLFFSVLDNSLNRPKLTVFLISFMFALAHTNISPLTFLVYMLMGWLLLRARTIGGSLYVSIWLHALYNFGVTLLHLM